MGWKATGEPTVRKQRDKWVVRVDGIDTETGKARPRQVGTYLSQRAAKTAARRRPRRKVQFRMPVAHRLGCSTVGWHRRPT